MTMHILSITSDDVALLIADGTPDSERADAIIAAEAFTDGDHADEILRPGAYAFYVEPDTDADGSRVVSFIGGRLPL